MSEKLNLFIATPCYGALTHAAYTASLLATKDALRDAGVDHQIRLLPGDSLVPRARGVLTARFMASDCNRLMFIDGDLWWHPESILRLLRASVFPDVRVCCGIYPRKEIPARFPVNFLIDGDRMLTRHDETGYVAVKDAPTGFLMIRRDVIEEMMTAYPERKCSFREEDRTPAAEAPYEYDLYPTPIDVEAPRRPYLSEDFGFSRLWQALGGYVWADPEIRLAHYGQHRFEGDIAELFRPEKPQRAQDIDGWMTDEELGCLSGIAAGMSDVIEVGSWKGRSTFALLSSCRGTVTAVDHWLGSEGEREGPHREAVTGDVYAEFVQNVGQFPNLRIIRKPSIDAASEASAADMVFIDGGHRYEDVATDIEVWRGKARKVLCGHDYHIPDVARAVNERLVDVSVIGSIWMCHVG